jgi:Zn-dependent protease
VTLLVLVVSLGLFVASLGESKLQSVLTIVGVLLFHELGHWVGMRIYGYRDVRMFFIPFFGAAVSGDPDGVAGSKRGIVLLLGPLPGIALAYAIVIASGGAPGARLRTLAVTLAALNTLNLLPFEPLDGGRLVHLVLASRARFVEVVSVVAAAAGLGWLAVRLDAKALYVVAALTLLGVGRRLRIIAAAKKVRAKHADLPTRIGAASDAQIADVLAEVLTFVPHAEPVSDARIKTLAAACRQIWGRATSTAPRWSVSLALGAAQLVGFALGVGALVLAIRSAHPTAH